MNRTALSAEDAVTCTLCLVIADDGTENRHRIILEELFSGIHDLAFFELRDDLRNRGADRASLLAHRYLALKAAIRLIDNCKCHCFPPGIHM